MPLKVSRRDAKRYQEMAAANVTPAADRPTRRRRDIKADAQRPVPGMNALRDEMLRRALERMEAEDGAGQDTARPD